MQENAQLRGHVLPGPRGQPGYAPHLDRDNDGIACEPHGGSDGSAAGGRKP
ncbi:excalibur calcium-binding domain-containing protein [Sphingomonas cavernae]